MASGGWTGAPTPRHARWWVTGALGVVVLVGVLVLVLRSPTFRATATAVATPADVAGTVVGLAATVPVRSAAARDAGVDTDRAPDVDVTASTAGIVTVAAPGDSPEQARDLARATVVALADTQGRLDTARLRADLAPLDGQMLELTTALRATPLGDPARGPLEQRYAALATAVAERTAAPVPRLLPDGDPVVTTERPPWVEVLLTVLAVAALVGVGLLVARALRGERAARARRERTLALARVDGPHAVVHPGDDVPAVLTRLYADVVRGRGPVLVFQLADPRARDVGRDLVEAARITGDVLPRRDLTADGRHPVPDDRDEPAVYTLRRPRPDDDALGRVLAVGVRSALVAVDTRRALPARLADTVSALEGAAVGVRGVVVWRGRFPRAQTPPTTRDAATVAGGAPPPGSPGSGGDTAAGP
ncbi:hypothetical protein Acsp06_46520 [Actinomycetospora sp. NBRC 106375]|uniref:hypothetical protein n=1 Tax=Actinomycetospora sp. NBRC 106375 TaxID=3032207 RepID=UPI0024A28A2D|nr:hypothetical protein [Actinomycetospora sp. NBRC 106375]GLZ48467.1 hypothetical protein Acsp06_46520 [Actinomycetospora sp. NBRC 106375]